MAECKTLSEVVLAGTHSLLYWIFFTPWLKILLDVREGLMQCIHIRTLGSERSLLRQGTIYRDLP